MSLFAFVNPNLVIVLLSSMLQVGSPSDPPASPPRAGDGTVKTAVAFPAGKGSGNALLVERSIPAEVRVGEPFDYEIKITNLTETGFHDLELVEQVPEGFAVKASAPQAERVQGVGVKWVLPELAPGKWTRIRVNGVADRTGVTPVCVTVTFKMSVCVSTNVVKPALALRGEAPADAIVCDEIPLRLIVTNTGTGTAKGVSITDQLPAGWTTTDGKTAFRLNAGDLATGQSREFAVKVRSAATGTYTNRATAAGEGGLTAETTTKTILRRPILRVSNVGPKQVYIGRSVSYEITVTNEGDAPARNTVVADEVAAGADFVSATDGGRREPGKIIWELGTLDVGASRTVSATIWVKNRGSLWSQATATAYCAEAKAVAALEARGVPAVLLEVRDNPDPIEVGGEVTYEIVVTNQGTAEFTNMAITCELPAAESYVSSDGPTAASVQGAKVQFGPLPVLAPKATVTYHVVVRGTSAADVRFRTTLFSDQSKVPVEETESTHIYGD